MATAAEEPRSPVLADVIVVAGFVVLFTTFATGSAWSVIIGVVMLLAGALWAGTAAAPAPLDPVGGVEAPEASTPTASEPPAPGEPVAEHDIEGRGVVHGTPAGGQSSGRAR